MWSWVSPVVCFASLTEFVVKYLRWWFGEELLPLFLVILDFLVSWMCHLVADCCCRLGAHWLNNWSLTDDRLHLPRLHRFFWLCGLRKDIFFKHKRNLAKNPQSRSYWHFWNCQKEISREVHYYLLADIVRTFPIPIYVAVSLSLQLFLCHIALSGFHYRRRSQ